MSNVINGNVPDTGLIKGSVHAIIGRDGYSAYEVARMHGFEGTEEEWLLSLKGVDGTVDFEDLTPAQRESLRGEKGDSGVYVGSGNMPDGYNVQIDPNGNSFSADDVYHTGNKPTAADVGAVPTVATYIHATNNADFDLDTGVDSLYIIASSLIKNCPISGTYVFVRQLFFDSASPSSSRTQIMYPYGYPNATMPANGLAMRVYCNGVWSAWKNFAAVGDALTSDLVIKKSNSVTTVIATDGGGAMIQAYSDWNKRKFLSVPSETAATGYNNLQYVDMDTTSGKNGRFDILHTGNKPSGSYTGNGDNTERTINIGGIGRLLFIYGQHSVVGFACYYGCVMFNLASKTTQYYTRSYVRYENGVLHISTSDAHVNSNGTEFYYQAL